MSRAILNRGIITTAGSKRMFGNSEHAGDIVTWEYTRFNDLGTFACEIHLENGRRISGCSALDGEDKGIVRCPYDPSTWEGSLY